MPGLPVAHTHATRLQFQTFLEERLRHFPDDNVQALVFIYDGNVFEHTHSIRAWDILDLAVHECVDRMLRPVQRAFRCG